MDDSDADMAGAHMTGMVKIQKKHKNVIISSNDSEKANFVFNDYKELSKLIQIQQDKP
jgi:hypothetical protein